MARPLLLLQSSSSSSMSMMTLLFVVISILSTLSVTTFLCGRTIKMKKLKSQTEEEPASSSTRRSCSNKNKLMKKLNSSLSNRAISMAKMLSWRKVQAEEEGEEEEEEEDVSYDDSDQDDEDALWRKNILMGERCRPIDFSEKIIDHHS